MHYLHKHMNSVFCRQTIDSLVCACVYCHKSTVFCHSPYTAIPTTQLATQPSSVPQAEGLELMQLILKEKRVARLGSLKVLDFATTRCAPACERWVDLTGLKQLFAIFMGKSKVLPAAVKLSQLCGDFAAIHLSSGAVSCMQRCSMCVETMMLNGCAAPAWICHAD